MALLKKLTYVFLFAVLLFLSKKIVSADDCPVCSSEDTCQQRITCLSNQKVNLSTKIELINAKISLTKNNITTTQNKIDKLTNNISSVSGKIDVLEDSLAQVSNVLANRISQTYMLGRSEPILYLLSASDFTSFWQRFEYLRIVQKHDKKLMIQMAASRKNYDDQKTLLEDSKKKREVLSDQLNHQKIQLDDQNKEQKALLAVTQYQLDQAVAQLAAFQSYVVSQGGATLIDANPNWPKDYYSQRDRRWGNAVIAGINLSNEPITIKEYGCLVTSVAMSLTHRGSAVTPLSIGTNSSYYDGAAMFKWSSLGSLGLNPQRTLDRSVINSSLDQGKWVIVGMDYSPNISNSAQPFHFVVITSKNGDDYNLFDPFRGPNISFNSNYGGKYITEVITY